MCRWSLCQELFRGVQIRGPEDVGDRLTTLFERLDQEAIVSLAVGPDQTVRSCELVGLGSCSRVHADARDAFRGAIRAGACGILIAHNHPSGSTAPSDADQAFTQRILQAANIVGLDAIDHIIVASNSWRSLREATRIWSGEEREQRTEKEVGTEHLTPKEKLSRSDIRADSGR